MTSFRELIVPHDEDNSVTQYWCYMPSKTRRFNYTWIIDYFSTKPPTLETSFFPTENREQIEWKLILHKKVMDTLTEDNYISLYLCFDATDELLIKHEISLINVKGEKTKSVSNSEFTKCNPKGDIELACFITMRELLSSKNELLPDDRLTIFFEITVIQKGKHMYGKGNNVNFSVAASSLPDDLSNMFKEKKHCDVEFIVGSAGEKFQAHKAILMARSSVFLAMFSGDTKENQSSEVKARDFAPEVFNEMLRFVYTDKVEDLDRLSNDLLIIANYYNLERLKTMCEEALYKNITMDNAAEVLILADTFSAENLKTHAINFAHKYATEFMKTAGFQLMKESHPKLVIETLETFANDPMISPVVFEVDNVFLKDDVERLSLNVVDFPIGEEDADDSY